MSDLEKWVLGLGAMAIAALAGALWKHIVEDAKVRERLASLEADNAVTKAEVKSLRERFHDFRDGTMKDAWNLFQKMKEEIMETVRQLLKARDKE